MKAPTAYRHLSRPQQGFTLIEIMVVVVILGILASLVVVNVIPRIHQANVAKAKQDIRTYESALSLFKMDNFKYPTTDQGLKALMTNPGDASIRNWKEGGYAETKKDPWDNEYQYQYPGTHGKAYDIWSFGADGVSGGDGENADIGNWDTN